MQWGERSGGNVVFVNHPCFGCIPTLSIPWTKPNAKRTKLTVFSVNNKNALLAVCYLIYTTLARELDNMLKPPTSLDEVYHLIDTMQMGAPRNQVSLEFHSTALSAPSTYITSPHLTLPFWAKLTYQSAPKGSDKEGKPPKPLAGGMTYIYDPSTADRSGLEISANIPVVQVPAHVLMTTENPWYAGPGDPVKKE